MTAISALACNDHLSTGPGLQPGGESRDDIPGPTSYTMSVGVAQTNDVAAGDIGPFNGGLSVPAHSLIVIRITGQVTVSANPNLPCTSPTYPALGSYGPRTYDEELGIQISRTGGGFVNFHHPGGNMDVLESDTLYTPMTMDLTWWRKGILGSINCPNGGSGGLYAMSGTQTVTVDVVQTYPEQGLIITPNSVPRLNAGDTLTFTLTAKNPHEFIELRSKFSPFQLWNFLPDSSAANPTPTHQNIPGCVDWTCKFTATVSGTIKVYSANSPYTYDPISDSVLVHVDVVTCPWKDDSIMDDPGIRKFLKAQLDTSLGEHLERGGVIYRLDATGNYIIMYSPGAAPPRSECRFTTAFPPPVEGYTLVGIWHTHPAGGGQTFSNCPDYAPGAKAKKGPSRPWDYDAQAAKHVPEYIIDPDDIFRIRDNPGRKFWQSTLRTEPWKSCPGWIS